jgi:hypothetical protein
MAFDQSIWWCIYSISSKGDHASCDQADESQTTAKERVDHQRNSCDEGIQTSKYRELH